MFVLMMRKARSRPGYVNLEVLHRGQIDSAIEQCIVPVGDSQFISGEMYRQTINDGLGHTIQSNTEVHGPAVKLKDRSVEMDAAFSFPCYDWPSEANEWMNRPRLHGWPDKALRDQIVQGGCHLVPVGDKTSADPFLQWRISFTTAERKLIHSLTHVQFLVYGLLKYFLKQISGTLEQMLGEADILSSYIIKTSIFHAVEITTESFWQEKHTFLCFMFCLKILVNWVKAGHCPNYFIKKNNMFLGKVHGENQRKLLYFLTYLHHMNWGCLSVGTVIQPTIGEHIRSVRNGVWEYVLPPPTRLECEREALINNGALKLTKVYPDMISSLELLSASKSDIDEFIAYFATGQSLSCKGMKIFGEHINARGNKEKYKSLRKCKNLLGLFSTMYTSPGLLGLATYHYKTGNYMKALEICDHMTFSFKMYLGSPNKYSEEVWDRYTQLYCGRGYNLLHKCQAFVTDMTFNCQTLQFCPSQLQQVITSKRIFIPPHLPQFWPPHAQQEWKHISDRIQFAVPPLPYAVFLSFLCYHELGDARRRDGALIHLQTVKYDVRQGVNYHWIVHNILGICYEMVGDTQRALREYRESLGVRSTSQYLNPARELIERLQHFH